MKIQLEVIKADGTAEEYLHTKVIGTLNNALARCGEADVLAAEHLAEAITYYLYEVKNQRQVSSSEIFAIVKAVLASTGYERAADALEEHYFQRKLRRSRVEVLHSDIRNFADLKTLCGDSSLPTSAWDKSRIVENLIGKNNFHPLAARTIASMVEEKVLGLGMGLVPSSLINQLVLGNIAIVMQAQNRIESVL